MYLIQKGTYEYVIGTYEYVHVHTSMSQLQTSIYKYVLDLYCTEACLTGRRLVRVAKEIVPVSDWNEV